MGTRELLDQSNLFSYQSYKHTEACSVTYVSMWVQGTACSVLQGRHYHPGSQGPAPECMAQLPLSLIFLLCDCQPHSSPLTAERISLFPFPTPGPRAADILQSVSTLSSLSFVSDPGKLFVKCSFNSQIREMDFLNRTLLTFLRRRWWGWLVTGSYFRSRMPQFVGNISADNTVVGKAVCHLPFACVCFLKKVCFYSALWCDLFLAQKNIRVQTRIYLYPFY